ncbi:MAG: hypothetical protein ACRDBL_11230 [Rhabdaerophilum sp.]
MFSVQTYPSVLGHVGRAACLVAGLLVLNGCGSTASNTNEAGQIVAGDGSGFGTALIFGGRRFTEPPPAAKREYSCPKAEILDGTVAYRSGDASSARGIAYQAAIGDIARECALVSEAQIRIRVGIQGRVILGEAGNPGTFTIPVRVAVRRGSETVYSKMLPASVTIPPNDTQATFIALDEGIVLPVGVNDPGDEYTVLVGLDPQGGRSARNRRR